ncbi:MFS transporter [Microbacterium murale]|uniref:MFS family permease n=1 Tax=Microbacterium murale TaxID=1081040 RepID=A0ABU0P976_9MICO|nr:MFS transporter [Microbacterium murale]MDQ0643880.1 MFS family permease [Microbacterium murale]
MTSTTATPHSVIRTPGIMALMSMSALCFAGFGALVSTVPLWAVRGGADEVGGGLVNAVMMAATVAVQTTVPAALRRFGWTPTLLAGVVLLGAPSLVLLMTDALPAILALSAVRGAGFAVITVCGSSAVARLVEPARRGRAIGLYGLSISAPQILLVPTSVWIADHVGFWVVFAVGAAPLIATVPAFLLARRLDRMPPSPAADHHPHRTSARVWLALIAPSIVLLTITAPGGALLTFVPQFPEVGGYAVAGLFALTACAAAARWLIGGLADRFGHLPFQPPLLLLGAAGLALCVWSMFGGGGAALIGGMAITGIAYGSLQNVTLIESFAAVGPRHRDIASAVWNIGFDCGTGIGALVVGFIAAQTNFGIALSTTSALCVVVAVVVLVRILVGRGRRHPAADEG